MKLKYKVLPFMLLIVTCTSMFFFSKLDNTFNNNAATAEIEGISQLSPVKQLVINQFKKLSNFTLSNFHDPSFTNSVIVKFNAIRDGEVKKFKNEFNLTDGIKLCDELNIYYYECDDYLTLDTLIDLNQSDLVEYVEADYAITPHAERDNLWGIRNQTYSGIDINVTKAWEKSKGNSNLIVAVIDTGVDYNHPDLKNNIWRNAREISNNGIDDDGNGYVDDISGWNFAENNNNLNDNNDHGTHVAGIIAASENGIGVVGVAPKVKIMPLIVFKGKSGNISSIIKAISYAKKNGASIVNMSLTTTAYDQSLRDIMATSTSILFVSAAGNDSQNNNLYPKYPANYDLPNNITVASINQNGALSSFSNYGYTTVHVAAPGNGIYSTLPNGKYGNKSGTSMAAPYVTGVAALVKSVYPSYSPSQIKSRILSTVKKLNSLQGKVSSGGLVDAGKACGF